MSVSAAIGFVSSSLKRLLEAEMKFSSTVCVQTPDEVKEKPAINLFLYKIKENPALKNMDWQLNPEDLTKKIPPPISLNLFYLITAYAADNIESQKYLGEAVRVLYEHPVIVPPHLEDELQKAREEIRVVMDTPDIDEIIKIWSTFSKPYRLSVGYEVSVVQIDKDKGEEELGRRVETVNLNLRAPYVPPVVDTLKPLEGVPGTRFSIQGRYLAGWKISISIADKTIAKNMALEGNYFTSVIPEDLKAGFYEVRVDVSHLFRKTFFFKVTKVTKVT